MRLFAILTTCALIALATAATDFQNAVKCGKKYPRVNQAIEIFCTKMTKEGKPTNDLTVPSKYATKGVGTTGLKGNKLHIQIKGTCSPPQWIPYQWCLAQFHDLCANSPDPRGWNWGAYGKNKCQKWFIQGRSDGAAVFGPRPFVPVGIPHFGVHKTP